MVEKELQKKPMIIGPKWRQEPEKYIASVVYLFQDSDEIEISAIGSNQFMLERLVKLFDIFNVKEINRRRENVRDMIATVCKLKNMNSEKDIT